MPRYRFTIAYDGSGFHGWQRQKPVGDVPELRTVQGVIVEAMQRLFGQPVNLVGASRTDAGVHALGQVAHADLTTSIPLERMAMAINSRLPDDVEVRAADAVPDTFDAIRSVTSKQYRYRIHTSPQRPLTLRHTVYPCDYALDLARMNDAAARLVGTHDFAGLANADDDRLTSVRTLHGCEVLAPAEQVHVVVRGDGFLYNMVRILAGTLVEVGRGRLDPDVIDTLLRTGDRRLAGPTLPPQGLCLEWIAY